MSPNVCTGHTKTYPGYSRKTGFEKTDPGLGSPVGQTGSLFQNPNFRESKTIGFALGNAKGGGGRIPGIAGYGRVCKHQLEYPDPY